MNGVGMYAKDEGFVEVKNKKSKQFLVSPYVEII